MAPERLDPERGSPSIVAELVHRDLGPCGRAGRAVPEPDRDDVMAVGKRVGLDHDHVADHPLHRESAAVHGRRDRLDDGAAAPVIGQSSHGWGQARGSSVRAHLIENRTSLARSSGCRPDRGVAVPLLS